MRQLVFTLIELAFFVGLLAFLSIPIGLLIVLLP